MDMYGPPLPPGFKLPIDEETSEPQQKKAKIVGPVCPAFLTQGDSDNSSDTSKYENSSESSNVIGPQLPESLRKECDDSDIYGPMPSSIKTDYNIVDIIEKRSISMRNKLENKNIPKSEAAQREEWMVVPDTSRKNQLGAISRCLAPGSKSSKKETDSRETFEEDKKTTEELKKYNKSKRNKSLLEIHRKDKKKEEKKLKKSHKTKEERKAFDRDEIAVKYFSKDQVNSVIDKAKYLNSRFARGRSQYL